MLKEGVDEGSEAHSWLKLIDGAVEGVMNM